MDSAQAGKRCGPLIATPTRAYPWRVSYDDAAAVVVIAVAAFVRCVAIFDQPWLDELWSLALAAHATSPLQIFTGVGYRIDNNHWLNTLYLYALGARGAFYPYRLLSLVSGVVMLVLVRQAARPWGRAAALLAVVVTGFSFILVEYSSEARGYAPAAACAAGAMLALRRFVRRARHRRGIAAVFGVACVLGFLSHASFVYAFIAAGVYAPVALRRQGSRGTAMLTRLAALFVVPTVFAAWLYVAAVHGMKIGGGPKWGLSHVLADTFTFTAGVRIGWDVGWIGFAAAVATCGYGAYALARRGHDEWVFLLTAGLVAPVLVVLVRQPQPLYPRYAFVAVPFVLLLAAAALGELARHRPAGLVAVAVILTTFLVGNGLHLARFYTVGRGANREVLEFLVAHTDGRDISLAAEQKFRMAMVFQYFTPRVAMNAKAFRYVPPQSAAPPEWFLLDAETGDAVAPALTVGTWPDTYRRAATFTYYGLSGCDWHVYHRVVAP